MSNDHLRVTARVLFRRAKKKPECFPVCFGWATEKGGGILLKAISIIAVFVFISTARTADAGTLSFVSDTISHSAPSAASTTHTFRFTLANAIPAGGKIVIAPESSGAIGLVFPATLDHTDVDLAYATSGPFVDRPLAGAPSATEDGIAFVSGTPGTITITLSSGATSTLPAGSIVTVEVGNNSTYQGTGDAWIANAANVGSFRIHIETRDATDALIDKASTLIAMVAAVTLGPADTTNPTPPTRSNGLPTGLLPGSTASLWVSLETDMLATCRYATTSGVAYLSMDPATTFTSANVGRLHYKNFAVTQNTLYRFYVRCANSSLTANDDDYLISFEVGVIPSPDAPPPPPPAPSGPSGGGGGGGLFLASGEVRIEGEGVPGAPFTITKDGVIAYEGQVSVLGTFTQTFSGLERGTYTWGISLRDPLGRKSATYNSTIYLLGGTTNIIGPVYVSPTISVAATTIAPGTPIVVSGFAIPLRSVQVLMNKQGDPLSGKIVSATTTASGNGSYSITISTTGLERGTYELKAHSLISSNSQSNLSPTIYIGIGEDPNPSFAGRSDLNGDGRVNLTDFAVLLFHWRSTNATADINQDGIVNLNDLSIMLANWTG